MFLLKKEKNGRTLTIYFWLIKPSYSSTSFTILSSKIKLAFLYLKPELIFCWLFCFVLFAYFHLTSLDSFCLCYFSGFSQNFVFLCNYLWLSLSIQMGLCHLISYHSFYIVYPCCSPFCFFHCYFYSYLLLKKVIRLYILLNLLRSGRKSIFFL